MDRLCLDCCSMATENLQLFSSKYMNKVDDTCCPLYFICPPTLKETFCTNSTSTLNIKTLSDLLTPQHNALLL